VGDVSDNVVINKWKFLALFLQKNRKRFFLQKEAKPLSPPKSATAS
jgi:hypothetical protein